MARASMSWWRESIWDSKSSRKSLPVSPCPARTGASSEGRGGASLQPCTNWMKFWSTISARLMLRVAAFARPVALGSVDISTLSGGGVFLGTVGLGELEHAVEGEVRLHRLIRSLGGTEALLVVAAVDPVGGEAKLLRGDVV